MKYITTLGELRQLTEQLPDSTEINGVWGAYICIEDEGHSVTFDTEDQREAYGDSQPTKEKGSDSHRPNKRFTRRRVARDSRLRRQVPLLEHGTDQEPETCQRANSQNLHQ